MYNPLLPDVTKLKDADLESKILDVSRKYQIAARTSNGLICEQLIGVLNMLKDEQYRRQVEATQKLMKKQDKDFDDLINVN